MTPSRLALVFCPLWAHVAPPALAYLAAAVEDRNPALVDLNHAFYERELEDPGGSWWTEADHFVPFMGQAPDRLRFELSLRLWEERWKDLLRGWVERLAPYDVVGLSTNQTNLLASTALARALKRARPRTILAGGPSVNMDGRVWADMLLSDGSLDAVLLGTGEDRLPSVLDRLDRGETLRGLPGVIVPGDDVRRALAPDGPLPSLVPRYDGLPMEDYYRPRRHWFPVYAVTGCVARCRFCTIHEFHPRWRVKPLEAILAELEGLERRHGARSFFFADGMFLGAREPALALFREARRRGWTLALQIRLMPYWDDEELVEAAGACVEFLEVGLDGGSERVRRSMGKMADAAMTERIFARFYRHGLPLYVNLVVGYPDEEEEDFRRTETFVRTYLAAYLEKGRILGLGCNAFFLPNGFPRERYGIDEDALGFWRSPTVSRRVRADRMERLCRLAQERAVGRSFVYTLDHVEGFPLRPARLPAGLPDRVPLELPHAPGQVELFQGDADGCLVCEGWAALPGGGAPEGIALVDAKGRPLAWGPCTIPRRDLAWWAGRNEVPRLGFRLRHGGIPGKDGLVDPLERKRPLRLRLVVFDGTLRPRGLMSSEPARLDGTWSLRRRRLRDRLLLPGGRLLRRLAARLGRVVPSSVARPLAACLHRLRRRT